MRVLCQDRAVGAKQTLHPARTSAAPHSQSVAHSDATGSAEAKCAAAPLWAEGQWVAQQALYVRLLGR